LSRPIVLLFEPIHERALEQLKQRAEVRMAESLDEDALLKDIVDVEGIIIRANGRVTRRLMEAAPKLKVVARHGTGVEAIDRKAAHELGITVVNSPAANFESVAEQCLAFMLILGKRIREADLAIRAGDWDSRYRLIGIELFGKTLGLVGFGRIGQRVAEMAHRALSMSILYYDLVEYPQVESSLGAERVSLDDVLKKSDFVSIHVPLVPETHGLIDTKALKKMKPQSFLINSSRGPVVVQKALLKALKERWIAGAGLDVYDPEPLPADDPLLSLDNVILSPHMAGHTDEALYRMAQVAEDVMRVIEGQEPEYPVRWDAAR
jgi:D-3-phosphoglycerate dehydrogenase